MLVIAKDARYAPTLHSLALWGDTTADLAAWYLPAVLSLASHGKTIAKRGRDDTMTIGKRARYVA